MIQVFQIKPEYSGEERQIGSYSAEGKAERLDFGIVDLGSAPQSYTFIVKTRDKPGIEEREEIKGLIRGAWDRLFDTSGSNWDQYYGVKVTAPPLGISVIGPSSEVPTGSGEFPELEPGFFYLVFVHMSSEEVTPNNSEANREDLREAFRSTYGAHKNPPRIALLPIYNCTIELITGAGERQIPREGDLERKIMRRHGIS